MLICQVSSYHFPQFSFGFENMCIVFIYTDPRPKPSGYRLIMATNRDECYKRPTKAAFLCGGNGIIGGRDMVPGRDQGMWLGAVLKKIPRKIAAAVILSVAGGPKDEDDHHRGLIVYDYLATPTADSTKYFQTLKGRTFAGFNLVTVEITKTTADIFHHTNHPVPETLSYPGKQILAFGNSNPACPLHKVTEGRELFENIIEKGNVERDSEEELIEKLLMLLKSKVRHLPDAELEKRVGPKYEYMSQVYVKFLGVYGTRTHTIILVDHDGNLALTEHTMKEPIDADNPQWKVTVVESRL